MISTTLREYKENYKTNLDIFLNDYEDNTETFFLQKELEKYQEYQGALTIIPKKLKYPTDEELKSISIHSGIASQLKIICPTVYDDIVSVKILKIDFDEVDGDFLLPYSIPSLVNIDFIKLENYTKSSILILEFIANEINPPSLASQIYKSDKIRNINNTSKALNESENNNNELEQIPDLKNSITTFKWKPNSGKQLSTILWQKLKDEEFIASYTEFIDFHNAFNGSAIEQPLKISWTAKGKNNLINKQLLFYLLYRLAEKKLIDNITDNKPFFEKLNFVFCKEDGSVISNLDVSHSTFINKNKNRDITFGEEIIDDIIDILLQITAN